MLTVKGKTIVFLTAHDLANAGDQGRKTYQAAQDGPGPAPSSKCAQGAPAKSATAQPDAPSENPRLATAQLGAMVALLNDADHKLSQARQLIAEAFDILRRFDD